jgi:hypothetical protein
MMAGKVNIRVELRIEQTMNVQSKQFANIALVYNILKEPTMCSHIDVFID